MDQSDEQLVEAYRIGNTSAFEELIRRYTPAIYRSVYRLTPVRQDAEDITQEVFLKVWQKLASFDSTQRFKPWIFMIARNTAIDHLRKRSSFSFSDLETDEHDSSFAESIPDHEPLPDTLAIHQEDKTHAAKAFASLSPTEQEVLTLYYEEHLSFEEIGEILSKPPNTVKSQHHRAIIKLRTILTTP